ncbi:hypothetical protein CFC21_043872 [Triticum aestivum]|uniref:F-box domain-containing protein n=2 Tax=Triticum aestivum TaxID=4565 RepID=A0A9R1FQH3_WHEAT|nr:hypothetical protein CFC21_043872 [Triticum aestivum]CDM82859.1 unnamed protein product [Triticum aestivum]
MGHSPIAAGAGRDRLSDLGDDVVGHILSFLDAKEAARAAALSSRWRDVYASVHTVSLELPERPLHDDLTDLTYILRILRPFVAGVTAALFARDRRAAPGAAAVPLRTLRVCMEGSVDYSTVGLWVTHALRHGAPGLELDLRLGRDPVCWGVDHKPVHRSRPAVYPHQKYNFDPVDPSLPADANEDDDAASSDDEMPSGFANRLYIRELPRPLFSCATLRTLRLGSFCLSTPEAVSLPSLEVLRLTNVREEEEHVQRLISACPLLADLMVEACGTVTALRLVDNTHLRRLAIRLCDNLATVDMDASQLLCFEYLGAIPDNSFLAVGSGVAFPAITPCKIDTYAARPEEAEDLVKITSFLQLFVATKHLHLCSTPMGSCFVNLPEFPSLSHLELNGCILQGDDPAFAIAVTSTILNQAPNLELLTLVFQAAAPQDQESQQRNGPYRGRIEGELVDTHLLHYDKYDTIDYALMVNTPVPPCLVNRVSKIELVHYQGGKAQRTLAKFLLGNAPALKMLYCGFAEGPEWLQMQLMREIEGWVINETASKEFR